MADIEYAGDENTGDSTRHDSDSTGPGPNGPTWVLVVGVAFLAAGVLFLMALVVAAVLGHAVPDDGRMLVVFALATVLATGSAFLGGWAHAHGTLHVPVPFLKELTATKFGVGGGVAVFFLVSIIGYWLYGRVAPPSVGVQLQSATMRGGAASNIVELKFAATGYGASDQLIYTLYADAARTHAVKSEPIPSPHAGQATIVLGPGDAAPAHAQLEIQSAAGATIATSRLVHIQRGAIP